MKPSAIAGYRPGQVSWDAPEVMRSGQVSLRQALDAFQRECEPVLKDTRRPNRIASPPALTYCKGR